MKKALIAFALLIVGLFATNLVLAKNDSDRKSLQAAWEAINQLKAEMAVMQSTCNSKTKDISDKPAIKEEEDKTIYQSENYTLKNFSIQ